MKFVLLVEGQTEELGVSGLLNRWLSAQFRQGIGVSSVAFIGWSELCDDAPKRVYKHLSEAKPGEVIAVVSLMDLYGPDIYSSAAAAVSEKYSSGRAYMHGRVQAYLEERGRPEWIGRYRHYFAVHEVEAWLVAQPSLFRPEIRARLESDVRAPETINFNEPPGKLLERLHYQYYKRAYKKTVYARKCFPRVEDRALMRCPYLMEMLEEMRELVRLAGATPVGDWHRPDGSVQSE